MPLAARRVFRLGLSTALSLVVAYAMNLPVAYLAPVIALVVGAAPTPPPGAKGLAGLIVAVLVTLGIGLLLVPLLERYAFTAVVMIGAGLFFSNFLSIGLGKQLVGTLLAVGLTMIPAAGSVEFALGLLVVHSMVAAIAIAIVCQWLVYPWFPEDPGPSAPPPAVQAPADSTWIALRAALIVLPPFLLAMTNPASYMPLIMKSIMLGQQGSMVSARSAGRELLGSTFVGGCCAAAFWFALKLHPNLWMYFLWMLLFGMLFASRMYQVTRSRYPASFWQNAGVTMLILVGPAVEDSANGKDVYEAFAVRMALFVAVTGYAWCAIQLLEGLRQRHRPANMPLTPLPDANQCS